VRGGAFAPGADGYRARAAAHLTREPEKLLGGPRKALDRPLRIDLRGAGKLRHRRLLEPTVGHGAQGLEQALLRLDEP